MNWSICRGSTHWKENLLLFEHVAFQLLLHVAQVIGEAVGAVVALAMHLLDAAGQTNQLWQLFAVAGVEAAENMGNQLLSGSLAPVLAVAGLAAQGLQFGGDFFCRDAATFGCLAQAQLATAAEVQIEGVEYPRGAGYLAGQGAEGLVQQLLSHGNVLGN